MQPHLEPMSQATGQVKSCSPVKACLPVTQTSALQKLHTHGTLQTSAKSSPIQACAKSSLMKTPSTASSPKSKIPLWTCSSREVNTIPQTDCWANLLVFFLFFFCQAVWSRLSLIRLWFTWSWLWLLVFGTCESVWFDYTYRYKEWCSCLKQSRMSCHWVHFSATARALLSALS